MGLIAGVFGPGTGVGAAFVVALALGAGVVQVFGAEVVLVRQAGIQTEVGEMQVVEELRLEE